MDPEEQPRLWRQLRVQSEFKKQLKLIEEIKAIRHFDDTTIQALRRRLRQKTYRGEPAPAAKTTTGPHTITNQTAFEVYRQLIEHDLKHNTRDWWEAAWVIVTDLVFWVLLGILITGGEL
jgi:hypothetical protein